MEYAVFIIGIVVSYVVIILLTAILRPLVFAFEPFFSLINWIIWFLHNPLRFAQKNIKTGTSRGLSLTLMFSGIGLIWMLLIYIALSPLRIITALYYDVILFSAVSLADNLQEFIKPKLGKMKYRKGINYIFFYLITIPFRLFMFIANGGAYILDSVLMFGVSVAMPTLTMLHGTDFKKAGTKVTQSGNWLVGKGNYAGTGVYFGIQKRVAEYYAKQAGGTGIVMVRVTLTLCKTVSSHSKQKRELVGLGEGGERLSKEASSIYQSHEHYRSDHEWWEYCILKPGQMGMFISTWRVRPVALINNKKIARLYGGMSHYCVGTGFIAGVISWIYLLVLLSLFSG